MSVGINKLGPAPTGEIFLFKRDFLLLGACPSCVGSGYPCLPLRKARATAGRRYKSSPSWLWKKCFHPLWAFHFYPSRKKNQKRKG